MAYNGELLEVMSYLPANFLFKISTTCKAIPQYLSEVFFQRKQAKNMITVGGDTDFFIDACYREQLEVHPMSEGDGPRLSIPNDSLDFLQHYETNILGSSNGILCCRMLSMDEKQERMLLVNPTTRSRSDPIAIPREARVPCDGSFRVFFSCEEDQYLLMTLVHPKEWNGLYSFKIYLPEQNMWIDSNRFYIGGRNHNWDNYVYLHGVLYLISDTGDYMDGKWHWPYIVACDMNSSKISSRLLTIPEDAKPEVHNSKLRIFRWGSPSDNEYDKSICLVKLLRNVFTVWVLLSSDCNGTEWDKVLELPMDTEFTGDFKINEFSVVNGRFLIFPTEDKVYRCDLQNQWGRSVEEVCGHKCRDYITHIIPFSSTLRSI